MKYDELLQDRTRAFAYGRRPKPQPVWTPPTLQDFAWGIRVQAFDQTLRNTGYVQVEIGQWPISEGVKVWDKKTIKPKPAYDGISFADTYERKYLLSIEVEPLITCSDVVVFEMPAAHGFRTESSLMAGSVIYDIVRDSRNEPPIMISKQHVGAVLCDNGNANKPEIREAVSRYVTTEGVGWNEHTRDALAIGLTYLYDLKRMNHGR